jgi:hypothetical protein
LGRNYPSNCLLDYHPLRRSQLWLVASQLASLE